MRIKTPKHYAELAALLDMSPQAAALLLRDECEAVGCHGATWVPQALVWKMMKISGRGNGHCVSIILQVGMMALADMLSRHGAIEAAFAEKEKIVMGS